jgi:zona occludens toxin
VVYAFTGLPGSGKSLTALLDFVLSQLRKGRHVFCNIAGLSPVMIAARLSRGGDVWTTSDVERLLHRFAMAFDDDDARGRREFWKRRADGSMYFADAEGLRALIGEVMGHKEAVLVLDECHEYLCAENWKLVRPFLKYLSMARHYGHDVVLITQHITDVWEPIRNRVHETHDFLRGKAGIRSHYVERVYHGWNVFAPPGYTRQRVNDKTLYALYSSHDGGARERMGYMSVWKSKAFVLGVVAVVALFAFSFSALKDGFFGVVERKEASRAAALPAPAHPANSNVIYVKYVVCGAFDCKATRPDGTVLTLPLDYASGRYPLEVRKYVQGGDVFFNPSGASGRRPGVPNAPR